jgi:hypothetical protein
MTHNFDVALSNVRLRLHLGLTGACAATSSETAGATSSSDTNAVLIPPCVGTDSCRDSDEGAGDDAGDVGGRNNSGGVSLDPEKLVLTFNIVTQEQPLQFNLNDGSVQQQFVRTGSTHGQALEYAWAERRSRKYATNYNINEVFHCRAIFVELRQQLGWGTSEVILSKEISLWKVSAGVSSYNVTLNQVVHQRKAMTFRAEVSFLLHFEPVCRSLNLSLVDVVPSALRLADWRKALDLPANHSFVLRARYLDPNVVKQVNGNLQHKSIRGCEARLNESTAALQNFIIDFPGTVPMRALRASCLLFTLETEVPAHRLVHGQQQQQQQEQRQHQRTVSDAPAAAFVNAAQPPPKLQRRSSLRRLFEGSGAGGSTSSIVGVVAAPVVESSLQQQRQHRRHTTSSQSLRSMAEKIKSSSVVLACAKIPVLFDYCPDDARTQLALEWSVRREMLQAFPALINLVQHAPRLETVLVIENGPRMCQMRNGHFTDAGIVSGEFCAEFPRPTQAQLALSFRDTRQHVIFSCTRYHLEWSRAIGLMKDCVLSISQQAAETPEVMLEHELRNRSQSRALLQHSSKPSEVDGQTGTMLSAPQRASATRSYQRGKAGGLLFSLSSSNDDEDEDAAAVDKDRDVAMEGHPRAALSSKLQFTTSLTRAPRFWEYWLHSVRERNAGDRTLRTNWVAWQHAAREWRNRNRDATLRPLNPVEYFEQNQVTQERLQGYADVFMHHQHVAICKANKAAALEPSPGTGDRDMRRRPQVSIYRFLLRPPVPPNKESPATRA